MRRWHVLLPVLVALGGGWIAGAGAAREITAVDVRPSASCLASGSAEDFVGIHHWDATSSSDRYGKARYYDEHGYKYAYPEEQYGYDASAGKDDEEAVAAPDKSSTDQANGDAEGTVNTNPDQTGADSAEADTDATANATTGENVPATDDSTDKPHVAKPSQPHSYEYEYGYLYEDGYASDDSKEVDQPSWSAENDAETSEPKDQPQEETYTDKYADGSSSEESSGVDFGEDGVESSYKSLTPEEQYDYVAKVLGLGSPSQGRAKASPEPWIFDESYASSADDEATGREDRDSSGDGEPDRESEYYGGQYTDDGAEADDRPNQSPNESPPPAAASPNVDADETDEFEDGKNMNTSGPKNLGAVLSVAARSLDQLGAALCGIARQLEEMR